MKRYGLENFTRPEISLVLNRSPIIFKNLQIKSKSVKEGMDRRFFFMLIPNHPT